MILCEKQGMGLPGSGVISGMREVCRDNFAKHDPCALWFWTETNRTNTVTEPEFWGDVYPRGENELSTHKIARHANVWKHGDWIPLECVFRMCLKTRRRAPTWVSWSFPSKDRWLVRWCVCNFWNLFEPFGDAKAHEFELRLYHVPIICFLLVQMYQSNMAHVAHTLGRVATGCRRGDLRQRSIGHAVWHLLPAIEQWSDPYSRPWTRCDTDQKWPSMIGWSCSLTHVWSDCFDHTPCMLHIRAV